VSITRNGEILITETGVTFKKFGLNPRGAGLLARCTALKAEDIHALIKQLSEPLSQERLGGENHCFK